jgi:hypothetical protein
LRPLSKHPLIDLVIGGALSLKVVEVPGSKNAGAKKSPPKLGHYKPAGKLDAFCQGSLKTAWFLIMPLKECALAASGWPEAASE